MNKRRLLLQIALFLLLAGSVSMLAQTVTSQIVRDGTVGPNASTQPARSSSGVFEIGESLGARVGRNLFHSFRDFTLGTGDAALFTATNPTDNVISRVTGGNPSSIDGNIRSTIGGAHFYFLNPSGIFFGPNATLDLRGSFHASTADVLRMRDDRGTEFVAFSPDSLLRMATPYAFGFLSNRPAALTIQGSRLSVPNGAQLNLVAGPIDMRGGRLLARGGSIGIASAASAGDVMAGARSLDTSSVQTLGNVSLTNNARLDASELIDEGAGRIAIRAGRFVVDSSLIVADVVDSKGGAIDIDVRDTLTLNNGARIRSLADEKGDAASIRIHGANIEVLNESRIESSTFGSGKASDISIEAGQSLVVANNKSSEGAYSTGIASDVGIGAKGSGGDITIKTPSLIMQQGVVSTETVGLSSANLATLGKPGNIQIQTNNLQMSDEALITNGSRTFDPQGTSPAVPHEIRVTPLDPLKPSKIELKGDGTAIQSTASVSTQGGAGITLQANDVSLSDGALITTTVFGGTADAGKIDISADRVSLRGGSFIQSDALINYGLLLSGNPLGIPQGRGGDIVIRANNSITVEEPGAFKSRISTSTFGAGNGGNISLNVTNAAGTGTLAVKTGAIDSNNYSPFAGVSAGQINISADVVRVENGGLIESVAVDGTLGTSGQVTIDATRSVTVHASDPAQDAPSAISTSTLGAGNAGTLTISAPQITVDDGASIDSFTYGGPGKGGDIRIDTKNLTLLRGGKIVAASIAGSGNAGSVQINTEKLQILDGGRIVASTLLGSSGNGGSISLRASDSIVLSGKDPKDANQAARLEVSTSGAGRGGNVSLQTPLLTIKDGARITAASNSTAANAGAAGSIFIGTSGQPVKRLELSGGSISAYAVQGPGVNQPREGNININSDERVLMTQGGSITASVANGLGGDITIAGKNQMVMRDGSQVVAKTDVGNGGRIQIGSELFLKTANSLVSADAGVGNNGIVKIDAPEVDLQGGLTPPATNFLNVSSLLQPICAVRPIEQQSGRFVVSSRPGAPLSPEAFLQAFDVTTAIVAPASATAEPGQARLAEGAAAFRGGRLQEASEKWAEAQTLLSATGDKGLRSDALRDLGQTQQALGNHARSVDVLRQALTLAEETNDQSRIASALGALGNAYLALAQPAAAEEQLTRGLKVAEDAGKPALQANLMNNLGNLHSAKQSYEKAIDAYEQSAGLAQQSGDVLNSAKALANAARSAIEGQQIARGVRLLQQALDRAGQLSATFEKTHVQIHIAATFQRLAELDSERRRDSLLTAFSTLSSAAQAAQQNGDLRALSYALGNLGTLYQTENRDEEALSLTRQALRAAEEVSAPELLYRWHWKEGQIQWSQGHTGAAIDSYRRAVEILEETRQEALSRYGAADAFFRQAVAPVYVDLARALLQASELTSDAPVRQQLLRNARETVERLKAAEVRDYFRDECVADLQSRTISAESVGGKTAIVYPMLLPDRLELLVTLPAGLERHTVPVGSAKIEAVVEDFRLALQRPASREYLEPAQNLYRWLVEPYAAQLTAAQVETLVFVPDGVLRTIPMTALHNGTEFLTERYGVVVTPGLALVDPKPIARQKPKVLLAGLSVAVQGQSPLPAVENELAGLRRIYGSVPLLNERFTTARLEREMTENQPSIVHIASHANFSGDAETSWILTYDGHVTMQRLSEIVGVSKFRDDPLELLVLSACETAAGDERAALGLAGVALRAGARSALGSLWRISDAATSELIARFYEELKNPDVSRAAALQRAQRALLKSSDFAHPFYWSAFLMIGNWL